MSEDLYSLFDEIEGAYVTAKENLILLIIISITIFVHMIFDISLHLK